MPYLGLIPSVAHDTLRSSSVAAVFAPPTKLEPALNLRLERKKHHPGIGAGLDGVFAVRRGLPEDRHVHFDV